MKQQNLFGDGSDGDVRLRINSGNSMDLTKFYLKRFWICLVLALTFVTLIFVQVGSTLVVWRLIVCYGMSQIFGAMASSYLTRYYMFKDIYTTFHAVENQLEIKGM